MPGYRPRHRWTYKPRGIELDLSHPLLAGAVGEWLMDEAEGSRARNLIQPGLADALLGTGTVAPTWVPGSTGVALDFARASGQAAICDGPIFAGGAFTIVARIWLRSAQPNGGGPDYSNAQVFDTSSAAYIDLHALNVLGNPGVANAQVNWVSAIAASQRASISGAAVPVGVWHDLACTFDRSTLRLYQDGVLTASGGVAAGTDAAAITQAAIGKLRDPGLGGYFDGLIEFVRFRTEAYSADQIAWWHEEPYAHFLAPRTARFVLAAPTIVTLSPSGAASTGAAGTPTILPGVVTLAPVGAASVGAAGVPALVPGVVTVAPLGGASAQAAGVPALSPGVVTVAPVGAASAHVAGAPTILPGVVTVSPAGGTSGEAAGTPALTPGVVSVAPAGGATGFAAGAPAILPGVVIVAPAGGTSGEAVGVPALVSGVVIVSPAGGGSGEAAGTPAVIPGVVVLTVTGGVPAEAPGTPTLAPGVVTVAPPGGGSVEAAGVPLILTGAILAPAGGASSEVAGTPTLTPGVVTVGPVAGISTEAAGTPAIQVGQVALGPVGGGSVFAAGIPTVVPGTVILFPAGGQEAFAAGTPTILAGAVLLPVGGVSSEAAGTPTISAGSVLLVLVGGSSGFAAGTPALMPGVVIVSPAGGGSAFAAGTPAVVPAGTASLLPVAGSAWWRQWSRAMNEPILFIESEQIRVVTPVPSWSPGDPYITDEQVFLAAPADYPLIVPPSGRIVVGTDGVLAAADPWRLTSATTEGLGAVRPGMLVQLGPGGAFPRPESFAVEAVEATVLTLRRPGFPPVAGRPPAGSAGATALRFTVLTLLPQLRAASREFDRRYNVASFVSAATADFDVGELEGAMVAYVLAAAYLAATENAPSAATQGFAAKSVVWSRQLEAALPVLRDALRADVPVSSPAGFLGVRRY